jgi:hypothetical protein
MQWVLLLLRAGAPAIFSPEGIGLILAGYPVLVEIKTIFKSGG